jgi:hypothetical protein
MATAVFAEMLVEQIFMPAFFPKVEVRHQTPADET